MELRARHRSTDYRQVTPPELLNQFETTSWPE
jgi:hypothetical protein